jgi:phosphate transport system protein
MTSQADGHTIKQYDAELAHLHDRLQTMGRQVLDLVDDAVLAFNTLDLGLAQSVMGRDHAIDELERYIDGEVIRLLARRAPLGGDLRRIMTVSKSASDLERIADEAVRISSTVLQHFGSEGLELSRQLRRNVNSMMKSATACLKGALDLLDGHGESPADTLAGRQRTAGDDFESELRRLMTYAMEDPRTIGPVMNIVLVFKSLERIAHYAENLIEYVLLEDDAERYFVPPPQVTPGQQNDP